MYKSQNSPPSNLNSRPNIGVGRTATIVIILIIVLALATVVYFVQSQQSATPLSGFKIESVQIKSPSRNSTISGFVYTATTSSEQAQGFQGVTNFGNCNGYATNLSKCIGMMFIFSAIQNLCFYMHNTIIPLQQVWISGNGTVTSIYQAQPETDATVCHNGMYVFETNPNMQISIGDEIIQSQS